MRIITKREWQAYYIGVRAGRYELIRKRLCFVCKGKLDEDKRSDAKYCSATCRKKAYRLRKRVR